MSSLYIAQQLYRNLEKILETMPEEKPKSYYIANCIERCLNTADTPIERRQVIEKIAGILADSLCNVVTHSWLSALVEELEDQEAKPA